MDRGAYLAAVLISIFLFAGGMATAATIDRWRGSPDHGPFPDGCMAALALNRHGEDRDVRIFVGPVNYKHYSELEDLDSGTRGFLYWCPASVGARWITE